MTDTYPQSGARFELELVEVVGSEARYLGRIYLPAALHGYSVLMRTGQGAEACTMTPASREPPDAPDPEAWAAAHLQMLGRLVLRGAQKGPWQRRLFRWRGDVGDGRRAASSDSDGS